jgi:predicted nucleic acid-binding Zn ribbon protein
MPKCPHCGEPIKIGQTTCYACGQKVTARRSAGRKRPFNPMIPVIAGAAIIIVAVGLLLTLPGKPKEDAAALRAAEQERLADSVRRANREQRMQSAEFLEAERYRRENAELQDRFDRLVKQTVGDKPTPEQQRLMTSIRTGLSQLSGMADRVSLLPDKERKVEADSLRAVQRRVRGLISDLGRAPKSGN